MSERARKPWVTQLAVAGLIVVIGFLIGRWRREHNTSQAPTPMPSPSTSASEVRHIEDPLPSRLLLSDRATASWIIVGKTIDPTTLEDRVRALLPANAPHATLATEPPKVTKPAQITVYATSPSGTLQALGKDAALAKSPHLDASDRDLGGLSQAATLTVVAPIDDADRALEEGAMLAGALAEARNAIVIDGDTGEGWSARQLRGAFSMRQSAHDARAIATVRLTRAAPGLLRAVSRGLGKLGLPELVVEAVPDDAIRRADDLLILVMQALIEGRRLTRDGALETSIGAIRRSDVREHLSSRLGAGGSGQATVGVWFSTRIDGDPARLAEVGFAGRDDVPLEERLRVGLSNAFGGEPAKVPPSADAAVDAATGLGIDAHIAPDASTSFDASR